MGTHFQKMNEAQSLRHGSLREHWIAFGLSFALVLLSYWVIMERLLPVPALFVVLIGSALIQMLLQLAVFFYLGREEAPRWNLILFLFMVLIFVVIIFGSLWIMANLDYRTMPMDQMHG